MSSSGQNLRISVPSSSGNNGVRRTGVSLQAKFGHRSTLNRIEPNRLNTIKANYLNNFISNNGVRNAATIRGSGVPGNQNEWIESPGFFQQSMGVANQLHIVRGRGRGLDHDILFSKAFAEFITELEKVIQKRMLNRDFIHAGDNVNVAFAVQNMMGDSVERISSVGRGDIQTLSEMTNRISSYDQSFWSEQKYKKVWSSDFRSIMDDTIKMILKTFAPNEGLSYFGLLIPGLKNHVPEMFHGTPTSRRPKGFIYKMDENKEYLRVIFNILMLRLPTLNTNKSDIWRTFSMRVWVNMMQENSNGSLVPVSRMVNVSIDHTDTSLKNMFYYIPEQERVLGAWPKKVRVNRGDQVLSTLNVNYNCQMLRSVLCKIRFGSNERENNAKLNYRLMFEELDNFYTRIRKMNPFGFRADMDPWIRLFVSMTFFSSTNDKILHIPWVIESLDSPLSPANNHEGPHVPYDFSELLRVIIMILEGQISGRTDDEEEGTVIYVIIKFINEHPPEYYNSDPNFIEGINGEDESKDDSKEDEFDQRAVRRRLARTPQQSSPQAPVAPNLDGMLVGAPYAGTPRERNFLTGSMVDRFQFNDALFQTPERPITYSCFMMAVIRCQMYMYTFTEGECTNVLVTNGPNASMSCEGKLVETVMDYSQAPHCLPFLKKLDGKQYIHLFNNVKYSEGGKYLPGPRNEEETQYWELAADEVWVHLERMREREINYNDLGDYGQAFADMFNVVINIYDIEMRGSRVCVISPFGKSPSELAAEGELLMIHIVFDQGHIHAVNNLRSFIRSKKRKSDVRQFHYCPVCDGKQTEDLTSSKSAALKHITECMKDHDKFNTGYKREEKLRLETQNCQVKVQFKKIKNKSRMVYECTQCHQEVTQLSFQSHVCTIQKKKLEDLNAEKIYVWDVEAAQLQDEFGLLKHECNCVYIRRVYVDEDSPEAQGRYFPSEVEFVDALMGEADFQNSIFLAHNSGSYDIHFLLRIFERSEIDHTYTPSPTSKHKFIMVQMTERNVKFLDFIRFMPGSLRNIAESFQINVSKGDFPYKFNNGENDSYVGCIPPLDTADDWWGLNEARSKKQVDGFKKWFEEQLSIYCSCDPMVGECQCTKKKWDFQEELKKYCLLDVIVLAKVVQAYRDKVLSFETVTDESFPDSEVSWAIPRIDPFQFMTLPQITMQTLVHGFKEDSFHHYGFKGVTSYFSAERSSRCPEALLWLKRKAALDGIFIASRENSLREFYEINLKQSFDGYCIETNTVYIFFKCSFWGCPTCMREYHERNEIIPDRGIPAKDVQDHYEATMSHLNSYYNVQTIWQHEYNTSWMDPYYLKCVDQMTPSDCFYGGRTEVFKLYANSDKFPEDEIHYYDVTSLYPSVYAHRRLPVGYPRYAIGYNIEKERLDPSHPNRYFGYVRIKVTPRNTDRIGLLPQRDPKTQRLTFPVHPMEGCWFTEEIYLAMENGYIIEEIYEIYYWEANQLSDQHLRGYVGYFLKMKQEAEGWKKLGASCDDPTPEEQEAIADRLYHQNGGLARIRPDKVKLDPVMRALAKLYLNSLWGKWAQKPSKECHTTIYGTQQFEQLWNDKTVERESLLFRLISPGVFKATYKKKNPFINPVPHGNIWLAASVTAWARITLHKQMIRISPERLIYCDTDSVIFLWPRNGPNLSGIGLGHWTDEYPKNRIVAVYALAPKLYALTLGDKNDDTKRYESLKAKGVQMTLVNQSKMSFENILPLIQKTVLEKETVHNIEVNNFSIFTNSTNNQLPFGNLFSRYNTKKVRVIITKRTIEEITECDFNEIAEINTFPPGYLV